MGIPADFRFWVMKSPLASGGTEDAVRSSDNDSENIKINDVVSAVSLRDKNVEEVERTLDAEAVSKRDKEKTVESKCRAEEVNQLSGDPSKITRGEFGGSDDTVPAKKCNSEVNQDFVSAEAQLKSSNINLSSPALSSQQKIAATVGKSSSNSSTNTVTKSAAPDQAIVDTKNPVTSDTLDKKDQTASDIVSGRDVDRRSPSRIRSRDLPRSSLNSSSKLTSTSKSLHTSTSRRAASNSKDFTNQVSAKVSSTQNPCAAAGSLESERCSNFQNRTPGSGLPRGDKSNHSVSQSASKPTHSPSSTLAPPPASISTLSDEELALLLHQELNSSPRVPRVPRVRQGAQLTSPTAASLLMKRSASGSGAKDFSSFSRRKAKDVSKDGHSRDEPRRAERRHSSPDRRRQDPESKRDEGRSSARAQNVKKNSAPVSNSTANSGRSSSTDGNDQHVSSLRKSPQSLSDEETGPAGGGSIRRTLPGLINEIMSKGKRMTYEELCNAVLPHWSSLRKHNGERYAYSSHSQAVLDCLRNRHEWARLVDRGPKTSSSRKRRKTDAEESEDNEAEKGRSSRREREGKSVVEAEREEFPKGKRNARKRRRLALRGRGLKDARKPPKGGDHQLTDDDSALLSNSSDQESSYSDEDEMQGSAGGGPYRSEESDCSDQTGTS
ncbi:hypothetical protein LINGRAHAP2_LOCUS25558 [Linum grandiflorum]